MKAGIFIPMNIVRYIKTYEADIMDTRGAEARKGISSSCVQFHSMHRHHIIRFTKPLLITDHFISVCVSCIKRHTMCMTNMACLTMETPAYPLRTVAPLTDRL